MSHGPTDARALAELIAGDVVATVRRELADQLEEASRQIAADLAWARFEAETAHAALAAMRATAPGGTGRS